MGQFDLTRVVLRDVEPADIRYMAKLAEKLSQFERFDYKQLGSDKQLAVSTVVGFKERLRTKYLICADRRKPVKTWVINRALIQAIHMLCMETTVLPTDEATSILRITDKAL